LPAPFNATAKQYPEITNMQHGRDSVKAWVNRWSVRGMVFDATCHGSTHRLTWPWIM